MATREDIRRFPVKAYRQKTSMKSTLWQAAVYRKYALALARVILEPLGDTKVCKRAD